MSCEGIVYGACGGCLKRGKAKIGYATRKGVETINGTIDRLRRRYQTYYGREVIFVFSIVYDCKINEARIHTTLSNECINGELYEIGQNNLKNLLEQKFGNSFHS